MIVIDIWPGLDRGAIQCTDRGAEGDFPVLDTSHSHH